jgi:hypothetical protein
MRCMDQRMFRERAFAVMVWALLAMPSRVFADIISEWNERASLSLAAAHVDFAGQPRTLAILHTALFDAVWDARTRAHPPLSPEAAVHAAAHRVLVELIPSQAGNLDAAYVTAMATVPDDLLKERGAAAGEKAALAILDARRADGYPTTSPDTYRPAAVPGVYITTELPVYSQLATIKPFALTDAAQFRPGPPPSLTSAVWARDYNETRELGGAISAKRTPWQTETAQFWANLSGTNAWNQVARSLISKKPLHLVESARLFMNLNVAVFDSYVAVFEAKYHYGFWRPITAIRNGDIDGNDATERDASWQPLVPTPLFPEYPCAHCIVNYAVRAILAPVFGTGPVPEFVLTTAELPGVTRKYASFDAVAQEVDNARIWAGAHFRNSDEIADDMGRRIGGFVLTNYRHSTQ